MSVGVTAPIVAAGAAGLAAFGEVDEALDTIITKTGATGDQADRLSQSFKNVGSNTHLPLQTVGEAIGEVNTQFGFMDKNWKIQPIISYSTLKSMIQMFRNQQYLLDKLLMLMD